MENGKRLQASRDELLERAIQPVVTNAIVYDAFRNVDRRTFVPRGLRRFAYKNIAFDLGERSSMSEPGLMGEMINLLGLNGDEKVLEIGTASGYGAALLSLCASEVHTVEHNPKLTRSASRKLQSLGYTNVHVHEGDGVLGVPNKAPFDAIIVTAGARDIPHALEDQLAEGGRMVIPVGLDIVNLALTIGIKYQGKLLTKNLGIVNFHPLMSPEQGGWTDEKLQVVQDVKKEIIIKSFKLDSEEGLRQHIADVYGKPVEEITDEDIAQIVRINKVPDEVLRIFIKS